MTMYEIMATITKLTTKLAQLRDDIYWANSDEKPYINEEIIRASSELHELEKRRDALANS